MDELHVPLIIRLQQEWASRPKPLGPRPTWESSVAEAWYGVWVRSGDRWWQRLALRVMGISPRLLTPFWGWKRYGS